MKTPLLLSFDVRILERNYYDNSHFGPPILPTSTVHLLTIYKGERNYNFEEILVFKKFKRDFFFNKRFYKGVIIKEFELFFYYMSSF